MQDNTNDAATGKADNLDKPSANNPHKHDQDGAAPAYPNKANNSKGAGSPYGGTQTADGAAPDGNQQILKGAQEDTSEQAQLPESAGNEYSSGSSYGSKGSNQSGETPGTDTDAAGSPVR